MKQFIQIFLSCCVGIIFGGILMDYTTPAATLPGVAKASITVDTSVDLKYRAIRELGDNWYLVEITYPHPFSFGKRTVSVVFPHLVRMHASELDKLEKLDNPKK